MDTVTAAQVVGTLKTVIYTVKSVAKSLPVGEKKKEVEATLAKAEDQLKQAEVQIASDLKYELCRNHFPPEIMLSGNDMNWSCPKCGNTKYTGAGIM